MWFLLILCLIVFYVIEVVFGSHSGVHNAELGLDPKCKKFTHLSTKQFLTQLLPILLLIAGLLFLLSQVFR